MNLEKKRYRYVEWMSAEEMHESSMRWMSELNFIRDEQLFFNDLVKSYTLQLIDGTIFEESQKVIEAILETEKDADILIKRIRAHENLLMIMVDDVNELTMEKAYIRTHQGLSTKMDGYMIDYQKLKTRFFTLITRVMKEKKQKQKRLLN